MSLSLKGALQRLLFPLDFRTLKLTPVARTYRLLTKRLGFPAPRQLFCNISVEIQQLHAPVAASGFQELPVATKWLPSGSHMAPQWVPMVPNRFPVCQMASSQRATHAGWPLAKLTPLLKGCACYDPNGPHAESHPCWMAPR